MNKNQTNNLARAALSVAFLLAANAGTLTSAYAQQILLTCTPPLVANSDGTDCVRPAAQQKTPDRLTAFSIRAGDGRHLGLYVKTGSNTWTGPSLDSNVTVQWSQEDAGSASLVLYTETPRIRTLIVHDNDDVSSSGLPGGSVLGERAY
jgi:hypothetical protein